VSRLAAANKPVPYGKFLLGVPSHRILPEKSPVTMSLPIFDYLSGLGSDRDVARDTLAARSFISNFRPIVEIVFNIMLTTYVDSLKVFQEDSDPDGWKWNEAVKFALEALEKSLDAEALRQESQDNLNLIKEADEVANAALKALKFRYYFMFIVATIKRYTILTV
jgi:hypothetical protein